MPTEMPTHESIEARDTAADIKLTERVEERLFENRLCVNCKYYESRNWTHYCARSDFRSPVDGESFGFCSVLRMSGQPCGPIGKLWEPK